MLSGVFILEATFRLLFFTRSAISSNPSVPSISALSDKVVVVATDCKSSSLPFLLFRGDDDGEGEDVSIADFRPFTGDGDGDGVGNPYDENDFKSAVNKT